MSDSDSEPKSGGAGAAPDFDAAIQYSDQPLHLAFQDQVTEILAKANLSEEQKQLILIAMSCPCCGGGGLSFSFKLDDDTPAKF